MYQVTLKDGTIIEAAEGKRVIDIAYQISEGLARNAAAAVVDGKTVDLRYPITKDINLDIKTFDSEEGKHAFWHTSSHIMALAVTRLYPGVQPLSDRPSTMVSIMILTRKIPSRKRIF